MEESRELGVMGDRRPELCFVPGTFSLSRGDRPSSSNAVTSPSLFGEMSSNCLCCTNHEGRCPNEDTTRSAQFSRSCQKPLFETAGSAKCAPLACLKISLNHKLPLSLFPPAPTRRPPRPRTAVAPDPSSPPTRRCPAPLRRCLAPSRRCPSRSGRKKEELQLLKGWWRTSYTWTA